MPDDECECWIDNDPLEGFIDERGCPIHDDDLEGWRAAADLPVQGEPQP